MAFDFGKVRSIHSKKDLTKNPVEFFYELNHPELRDLYPSQKEILEKWYSQFKPEANSDKVIQLDTGAWKTLVWLYIAESIRRTKWKKVLYVCADNFLVDQTYDKVTKYWLKASKYSSSEWENESNFLGNESICITNYHSVLNKHSIFRDLDIWGIIFDDSHNTPEVFEDKYTVKIEAREIIEPLMKLFKEDAFAKKHIESIEQWDSDARIMIPPYKAWSHHDEIKSILTKNKDLLSDTNKYNLENIKNNLECCFIFCSVSWIEVSMLYPNLEGNYFLDSSIERIFLSATVNLHDDFIRYFWVSPEIIKVDNPTYRPDRLFLFSKIINEKIPNFEQEFLKRFQELNTKTLILTPSRHDFQKFEALSNIDYLTNTSEANEKIELFKNSSEWTLVIANRYEWIDIDGDAGHFLVILNIIDHPSLKNKYLAEIIGGDRNLLVRCSFAGKITQAFWRTTRSSSDYSTIILLGDKLNNALLNRDNAILFSKDLIEDLKIWAELSRGVIDFDWFKDLCLSNLTQQEPYREYIASERTKIKWSNLEFSNENIHIRNIIASKERQIMDNWLIWKYRKCIQLITNPEFELQLASQWLVKFCWLYFMIASYCFMQIGNVKQANHYYKRAVWLNKMIADQNFEIKIDSKSWAIQAKNILETNIKDILKFNDDITSWEFEENVKKLWALLGYKSIRPEKEIKWSTLDNLWISDEDRALIGIECKNEKGSQIWNLADNWQTLNHLEWIKENYPEYSYRYFIVWNITKISKEARATDDMRLLNFKSLSSVYEKINILHGSKVNFPDEIQLKISEEDLDIDSIFKDESILIASLPILD